MSGASVKPLKAPFPWFGGKRKVVDIVWRALGSPKQYIEPFCGSAAVLLGARKPASLEIIGDANGFVANFWRASVAQPAEVARWADYPISHVDLHARHRWLMGNREALADGLLDADWPGCAKSAGWWLWGQCAWIGSGWCDWFKVTDAGRGTQAIGKIPHVTNAGRGTQAIGQIPHVTNAGRGTQAIGQIPHVTDAGRGTQAIGQIPHVTNAGMGLVTSQGRATLVAMRALQERLARVRILHGDWQRTLNHHYGGDDTAVFLDPPYDGFEGLYGASEPVAAVVADWCRENQQLRIVLCGHAGDNVLDGWQQVAWDRGRLTYGSSKTTAAEVLWLSPSCCAVEQRQAVLL